MRKLIVSEFVSLNGVMQAPGGPQEDPAGGFTHGGWSFGYWDEAMQAAMGEDSSRPADLLLGRKTYEIFAAFWPYQPDDPAAAPLNDATKYVASNTMTSSQWQPSVFLGGDLAEKVSQLKQQQGPNLHVYGSANLVQTLMKHELVDEFWLKIYPLTLGSGKRLFVDGTIPAAFKVTESQVSPTGIIIVNYERAGAITTNTV